jgi:hypothetical protein
MTLLIGTRDGVFRATDRSVADVERVLDCGTVRSVVATPDVAWALAGEALFRTTDGDEWTRVPFPGERARSFATAPDGTCYLGVRPAALYASTDGGDSWSERTALREQPTYDDWHGKRGNVDAGVSTIAVPPGTPDRLVVGIEPAGVFASDDAGASFHARRFGLYDDVHDVIARGPGEYVAATGNGLYRTGDVGRTWTRLDTRHEHLAYDYYQALHETGDGTLLVGACNGAPGSWGDPVDGALFRSDDGETLQRVDLPVDAFPVSFCEHDDRLVASTLAMDLHRDGVRQSPVLVRERDGDWTVPGHLPAGAWSVASLE